MGGGNAAQAGSLSVTALVPTKSTIVATVSAIIENDQELKVRVPARAGLATVVTAARLFRRCRTSIGKMPSFALYMVPAGAPKPNPLDHRVFGPHEGSRERMGSVRLAAVTCLVLISR